MIKNFKVVKLVKTTDSSVTVLLFKEPSKVNAQVVEVTSTNESEIIEVTKDADIILVEGVIITRRIMEASPKCKAIITPGVGFDNIDVNAATDNNIIVVNNPSVEWCVEEVSNHAITLLLACSRKLIMMDNGIRQGRWAEVKKTQAPMGSIYRQTLGIIGCGTIGRMTAKKSQCFGLTILGYDPYINKPLAEESGITLVKLSELLNYSDYVSVHTNLNEENWHLMGENEFRQMKPSAYFINTSRGEVVDEKSLIQALEEKWIAGAGLDVFEKEPLDTDSPLTKMDNVTLTPHYASYSDAAFLRAPLIMAEEAVKILSGRCPNNIVNKTVKPKVKLD